MFRDDCVQVHQIFRQVLLNNVDNLAVAEKDVEKALKDLRTVRVNDIVKKGLADLTYDSKLLHSLHTQRNK